MKAICSLIMLLSVFSCKKENTLSASQEVGIRIVSNLPFGLVSNVAGGSASALISQSKITSMIEDIKVVSLSITPVLEEVAQPNGVNNVTLYFKGSQIGTSKNCLQGDSVVMYLGNSMLLLKGIENLLEVRADIMSSTGVYLDGKIKCNIRILTVERISDGKTVSVSDGFFQDHILSILRGNGLGVAKNAVYTNQTLTSPLPLAKVASFNLFNQNSTESVRVTKITLTISGTLILAKQNNLKTSETSGFGSIPIIPQQTNVFIVNKTLPSGQLMAVDVFEDLLGPSGTLVLSISVESIGVNSNVLATSTLIAGQTITVQ